MIPPPAIRSVQLVGGPEDGMTVERSRIHAPGEDWPRQLWLLRTQPVRRLDVYVRCSWGRYRFKETR